MRILGIESSSTTASLAVIENNKLIAEYTINHTLKHSTTLMPMLDEMLSRVNLKAKDLDLISVSEGPGSFTGLRIGSATAKGIAHGLSLPVASIPTLEVIAASLAAKDSRVGVVVFARAEEVYYCEYTFVEKEGLLMPIEKSPIIAIEIDELINKLSEEIEEPIQLVGDGVEKFKNKLVELPANIQLVNPLYYSLSAKNVAILGLVRYYSNDVMGYYEQKPYYHKKSQAEREYEEKHQND